ncbi:HD domain-containing protein (plasmid) [Polymorphobacter sp. PAMC 29334]|uniref:HD domain-containing protein n=1 Tax=Polymorphobacter sp. PAMC 29334 TaxID=2862331 RepID=UPI001C66CDC8|nr:HD domain-containing protein [Polymorphobacter sp. PAMC 29334]QYE37232.1 HD domain-containing protein [Polymorphobacter sp. PAMC 29334]
MSFRSSEESLPLLADAEQDVDALLSSINLQLIRRYMDQRHWKEESAAARAADRAEPGLKLENVAAHSWHVADAVMLLAPLFPDVDQSHAVELAIVHDKLELLTGDFDPVGPDGQGTTSHAFDPCARAEKTRLELQALEKYLARLRGRARELQRQLLLETIQGESAEARLVKAVDKLQALAFVVAKKAGNMTDEHLSFSLRYSFKAVEYFPGIANHYAALVKRLMIAVADRRNISPTALFALFPAAAKTQNVGTKS